jgi:Ca2+-binding EF-hand superfamily protein
VNINYKRFKEWLELNHVLGGFNLTDKLVQELFSDIDPHKKGHFTLNDWLTTFGKDYFF